MFFQQLYTAHAFGVPITFMFIFFRLSSSINRTYYVFWYGILCIFLNVFWKPAIKIIIIIKYTAFNVRAKYFVWSFKGYLWNNTQKYLIQTLQDNILYKFEFWRGLIFKSSYLWLNAKKIGLIPTKKSSIKAGIYIIKMFCILFFIVYNTVLPAFQKQLFPVFQW